MKALLFFLILVTLTLNSNIYLFAACGANRSALIENLQHTCKADSDCTKGRGCSSVGLCQSCEDLQSERQKYVIEMPPSYPLGI